VSSFYRRALKKIDKLTGEQSKALLESAAGEIVFFQAILDSVPLGLLVCNEKHRLVMANKLSQMLLPINYREGVLLWSAFSDKKIIDFFKECLLNNEKVIGREIDAKVRGQSRLLSISVVPLVAERKVTGSLIYAEDITERRKAESRLRRAENLASLTTLAAGVAHEIKNPLGSISIHLQLMQKSLKKNAAPLPAESASAAASAAADAALIDNCFRVLNEEVERLNRIVVDFLFAVRPIGLELRDANLNALISDLVGFITLELEAGKVRCLVELDETVPPFLMDERFMKHALLNLIKNAQSAMPRGGLLTIATKKLENHVQIFVCDTGDGIKQENLAKIFEPYFTTKESGTGLGLTTVYKIIREHQGEISVDSREREGTNFEITLPLPQKEKRLLPYKAAGGGGTAGGGDEV